MIIPNLPPFDILLIEDDPADAHLVSLALKEGCIRARLHHQPDGREGLDFLKRISPHDDAPRPDLILLDLNMPRMNGREFLAAIKADDAFKAIPVVILTTSDVERDVVASYQLGASGYITKPVDMRQFVAAVEQLGDYWFTLTRLPMSNKK
ncbi:MAG: response regulator [Methylococcaceae bacterium]